MKQFLVFFFFCTGCNAKLCHPKMNNTGSFAPGQRFSSKDIILSPNEVVYLQIDEELIHAFGHVSELFLGMLGKMRMYSPEHRNMSLWWKWKSTYNKQSWFFTLEMVNMKLIEGKISQDISWSQCSSRLVNTYANLSWNQLLEDIKKDHLNEHWESTTAVHIYTCTWIPNWNQIKW